MDAHACPQTDFIVARDIRKMAAILMGNNRFVTSSMSLNIGIIRTGYPFELGHIEISKMADIANPDVIATLCDVIVSLWGASFNVVHTYSFKVYRVMKGCASGPHCL